MKERIQYLDALKGFAIFLVVLQHISAFTRQQIEGGDILWISNSIASFHMMLFFFISGYICHFTNGIDTKGAGFFIKRKAVALLLPFFSWTFLKPIIFYQHYPTSFLDALAWLNIYPADGFWFLPILFACMLVYLGYFYYKYLGIVSLVASAIGGVLIHEYYLIVYALYLFAFLFGDICAKNPKMQNSVLRPASIAIMVCLFLTFNLFFPLDANGRPLYSMLNLMWRLLCGMTGSLICFWFFKSSYEHQNIPTGISRTLESWGKMSLMIYVIHFYGSWITIPADMNDGVTTFLCILSALALTQVSYWLGVLCNKIPYVNVFLCGAKIQKHYGNQK